MENKYIIGIDGGSQSTKVVIFDTKGNVICEDKEPLKPMSLPKPGIVEHPEDDLWDSLISAARRVMMKFTGDKKDIIGVGLCTIRCCKVLLKGDGTLANPVISWMDTRAYQSYQHTDPQVKYVTTTSGYITHRLTGQFVDSSAAHYASQFPIDLNTWEWSKDPQVIKNIGIPREMLFDLKMPGEVLGHVTEKASQATGIPAGLPVVATANDKGAEALGAGKMDAGTVLVSLGTYITSMMYAPDNVSNTQNCWINLSCIPNRYLYESAGIRRGMWSESWVKNLLGEELITKARLLNISVEDYLTNSMKHIPAGSDGLMTILDWLAPGDAPYKKGMMIGFDGRHGAVHIYRSVLEAIALTMKNNIDPMVKELGIDLKQLVISGGGSNNPVFMQIFSDIFGVPTVRNVVNNAAGMGSAICAAVALGVYPDFDNAIANMIRIRDRFEPNADNHHLYTRLNDEVYKNITGYTDEILKKSYPIFG
ncbi:MAG: FGGY-family carbohydrate kinase [Brevinema sp.]